MDNKPKLCGVVTARGGSKSIPHKNLYPLAGMPLIYYCIQTAQSSGIFDRIIISTDDPRIAEVAKSFGVEAPFMRPQELAGDSIQHFLVVKHAIQTILPEKYEYAAIISPTAPLIQGFHWEEAWEKLLATEESTSITSALPMPHQYHPLKAFTELGDDIYSLGEARRKGTPRQELPKAYYSTAGIYIFKVENLKGQDFYGNCPTVYELDDPQYGLDINELEDMDKARDGVCLIKYPWIKEKDEEEYKKLCESYE